MGLIVSKIFLSEAKPERKEVINLTGCYRCVNWKCVTNQ